MKARKCRYNSVETEIAQFDAFNPGLFFFFLVILFSFCSGSLQIFSLLLLSQLHGCRLIF